ncbi:MULTISPECIES: hypothetical protein [unclassified Thioalkalivibrio]|uniref:hypothetical protein n=1 Tax=unclassified Thioalkalivibrio TaxID=2621013 RepID=UPI00036EA59E|nr:MULTISPECIES: hypothetical protein [unclassified Thioalkalivibrio]
MSESQHGTQSLPSHIRPLVESLIAHAREISESGKELMTIAVVGRLDPNEVRLLSVDQSDPDRRDRSLAEIRATAATLDADFVLLISESWTLEGKHAERAQEIIEEYGSIGNSPYKKEVATFSLETHDGNWLGVAPLVPKGYSKRKKTFRDPKFTYAPPAKGGKTELVGALTGLLPPRNPSADGPDGPKVH